MDKCLDMTTDMVEQGKDALEMILRRMKANEDKKLSTKDYLKFIVVNVSSMGYHINVYCKRKLQQACFHNSNVLHSPQSCLIFIFYYSQRVGGGGGGGNGFHPSCHKCMAVNLAYHSKL